MKTNNKLTCKTCKKNYNILTDSELCYNCFISKYKIAPNRKQFGNHDK
jgi:transposase-like protein